MHAACVSNTLLPPADKRVKRKNSMKWSGHLQATFKSASRWRRCTRGWCCSKASAEMHAGSSVTRSRTKKAHPTAGGGGHTHKRSNSLSSVAVVVNSPVIGVTQLPERRSSLRFSRVSIVEPQGETLPDPAGRVRQGLSGKQLVSTTNPLIAAASGVTVDGSNRALRVRRASSTQSHTSDALPPPPPPLPPGALPTAVPLLPGQVFAQPGALQQQQQQQQGVMQLPPVNAQVSLAREYSHSQRSAPGSPRAHTPLPELPSSPCDPGPSSLKSREGKLAAVAAGSNNGLGMPPPPPGGQAAPQGRKSTTTLQYGDMHAHSRSSFFAENPIFAVHKR